ncbi:hypothetical protein F5050DRAFT_1718258 [Lentinula boryana]|uniref:Uncharacterized protein n=1 Tax=Lentinula boryana TaxID=40481 RepID=A0ABQ8QUK1_9AGAR|nr:hypothetical protein F5050DRAFT_1718258 [Lentinula boryana]
MAPRTSTSGASEKPAKKTKSRGGGGGKKKLTAFNKFMVNVLSQDTSDYLEIHFQLSPTANRNGPFERGRT